VAFCRVTYRDIEGIDHSVEVEANSLYEVIAQPVKKVSARLCLGLVSTWPSCQFHVKVLKDTPVTYSVSLDKVQSFALHGTAKGPEEILRKKRIRELLGLSYPA
jgi:hypothetical protein